MAAKEMWDYLDVVVADYSGPPLIVNSQRIIVEEGEFLQTIHEADDASEEVISYSSNPVFYVTLQFPVRTESDIGTIFDYYFDYTKAYGRARSFKWTHPTDGHQYTVKFRDKLTRTLSQGGSALPVIFGIPSLRLKVLGRYDAYPLTISDLSSATTVSNPSLTISHHGIVGSNLSSATTVSNPSLATV